jgi:basic membrane lipoprotein Med (substrate-binding protein (PBP1-ABC) superfamily)
MRLEEVKGKIISGEIKVPTDQASLEAFLSSLK